MKLRKIRIAGDLHSSVLPYPALLVTDVESGELLPVTRIHSIEFTPGEPVKVVVEMYVGSLDVTVGADVMECTLPSYTNKQLDDAKRKAMLYGTKKNRPLDAQSPTGNVGKITIKEDRA